jgi:hypothetical protein
LLRRFNLFATQDEIVPIGEVLYWTAARRKCLMLQSGVTWLHDADTQFRARLIKHRSVTLEG